MDINAALRKTPEATRQLLSRMVKEELIQRANHGLYTTCHVTSQCHNTLTGDQERTSTQCDNVT